MIKIKREVFRAETESAGACGACEQCTGDVMAYPCGWDVEVALVDVEALRRLLAGSRWGLGEGGGDRRRGEMGGVVQATLRAEGEERGVVLWQGSMEAHAPLDLQRLLCEPEPCPARWSGCEGLLWPAQGQCETCGSWRA